MKISEAKILLASVMRYNIEQYEKGECHNTYVVPFFEGDPGVGKTAIPNQVAAEYEVDYFQTIVAQYDAGEMAGLPYKGEVVVGQDDKGNPIKEDRMIRLRPDYLPTAQFGIYNLDELPQAFLANQNICSQIVNEWRVGEHSISPGITICCTGNKPENKAGTTSMPSHLKDRLMFIPVDADLDDFLLYAAQRGIDPRIRAYLRQNPVNFAPKFDPGVKAQATPRSWEKASAVLSMRMPKHIRTQALGGTIGEGQAVNFEAYLRVEDKMPKLEDILKDPDGAPVFTNKQADILYMLLANLADIAKDENIEPILKYIKRLPNQEFAAYWASDAFAKSPKLLQNKHVTKWKMTDAAKLLY